MAIRPTFKLLAAATIGLAGITAAQAAPIIESWSYEVVGTWSAFEPAGVDRSADEKTLTWGTGNPARSSLVITDPAAPPPLVVNTIVNGLAGPGSTGQGVTITHNNFVITGSDPLSSATLRAALTLTPLVPPGATFSPPALTFGIEFNETPNTVTPCASTIGGVPCPDIFVLVDNAGFTQTFDLGGHTYTADVFAAGVTGGLDTLRLLTPAECSAAGAAAGCTGFATRENLSTDLGFGFTIATTEAAVPEPGILALLGIGLAGVGFASRRRSGPAA